MLIAIRCCGEQVPQASEELVYLTSFAGLWRYQDVDEMDGEERVSLRLKVCELRTWIMGRIVSLRPDMDWIGAGLG